MVGMLSPIGLVLLLITNEVKGLVFRLVVIHMWAGRGVAKP